MAYVKRKSVQKSTVAKSGANKRVSTSLRLNSDLRGRMEPYIFLRDKTLCGLIEEALAEYMERHPLDKEERKFWAYRKKTMA